MKCLGKIYLTNKNLKFIIVKKEEADESICLFYSEVIGGEWL